MPPPNFIAFRREGNWALCLFSNLTCCGTCILGRPLPQCQGARCIWTWGRGPIAWTWAGGTFAWKRNKRKHDITCSRGHVYRTRSSLCRKKECVNRRFPHLPRGKKKWKLDFQTDFLPRQWSEKRWKIFPLPLFLPKKEKGTFVTVDWSEGLSKELAKQRNIFAKCCQTLFFQSVRVLLV